MSPPCPDLYPEALTPMGQYLEAGMLGQSGLDEVMQEGGAPVPGLPLLEEAEHMGVHSP